MGYQTEVSGVLDIVGREVLASDIEAIQKLFWSYNDNGCDYLKDYDTSLGEPHYVQLELTDDYKGIRWDGTEKFYKILEAVNFVIKNMPEGLSLEGTFLCKGEEAGDVYYITAKANEAAMFIGVDHAAINITCPKCGHEFQNVQSG